MELFRVLVLFLLSPKTPKVLPLSILNLILDKKEEIEKRKKMCLSVAIDQFFDSPLSLSKKYLGKKELKHFSSAGLKALFLQITNLAEFAKSFYACKRLMVSTRLDRTNPPTAAEAGISTERHQKK